MVLFSRTTWVSQYHKGKTSLDLNEARDDGVLGCSGISWTTCKQSVPCSRQITMPNLITQFIQAGCSYWHPTKSVKALKANSGGNKGKGKVFPYSLPSVGPGADTGVEAVSPQVTWSESRHIPSSSLPLLSARPAFTFIALTRWRYL